MKFLLLEFCHVCILPDWPLTDVPGHAIFPGYFFLSHHLNRVDTSTEISVAAQSRQTWMEGDLGENSLPAYLVLWKCASSVVNALWWVMLPLAPVRWRQWQDMMFRTSTSVALSEITMWLLLLCLMFCLFRRILSLRYSCKTRIKVISLCDGGT